MNLLTFKSPFLFSNTMGKWNEGKGNIHYSKEIATPRFAGFAIPKDVGLCFFNPTKSYPHKPYRLAG